MPIGKWNDLKLAETSPSLKLNKIGFVQELKVLRRRRGTVLGNCSSYYVEKINSKDKGL
jgi:hypothetical protein